MDELTERILEATNSMLLEIVAVQAAADYDRRRERQAQGIEKARRQLLNRALERRTCAPMAAIVVVS